MKRGFFTIMSAQFFSSLADNALFVAAVELLRTNGAAEWQRAALVPMFALFYVILAPFVGAFADTLPKGVSETHVSLFDGTLQGLERTDQPAFCFQGHPEASPGPHDIGYLFDRFIAAMELRG